MTEDEFDQLHVDSMKLLAKELDNFAGKMGKDIKAPNDISTNFPQLFLGTLSAQVIGMDNFCHKEKAIAYCGGKEQFDAVIKKLGEASSVYGLKDMQSNVLKKYTHVLRGCEGLALDKLMLDKLQKVGILQGLQAKNPSFNPNIDMMDMTMYQGCIMYHPEIKNFEKKVDKMDREFLNDLLATGGEKYANLEIDILEKPSSNLTKIGPFAVGETTFGINVKINGKGIAKFEEPQKEMETGRSM